MKRSFASDGIIGTEAEKHKLPCTAPKASSFQGSTGRCLLKLG
jgi:hypothetical protein